MDQMELGSRRVLRPGPLLWVRALAWGLVLAAAVFVMARLFAELPYQVIAVLDPGNPDTTTNGFVELLAMLAMGLAALGTYGGLVAWGEDRLPPELAVGPAASELVSGLAIGGAMMVLIVIVMWTFGWVALKPVPVEDAWLPMAIALGAAVVEEVLFRLIAFRLFWRVFGLSAAVVLSAVLFGALHLWNPQASLFAAVSIAAAGVMLAGFYVLSGRVWLPVGIHAGWNFAQGWIFGAAVSGTTIFDGGPLDLRPAAEASPILSGGGFGPESSVVGLFVGTSVGAFTLWLAWKRGRFTTRPIPAGDDQQIPPLVAERQGS